MKDKSSAADRAPLKMSKGQVKKGAFINFKLFLATTSGIRRRLLSFKRCRVYVQSGVNR